MFAGFDTTPVECIAEWVRIGLEYGISFTYFHSTLSHMLQNVLSRNERRYFNTLMSTSAVVDYLNANVFVSDVEFF